MEDFHSERKSTNMGDRLTEKISETTSGLKKNLTQDLIEKGAFGFALLRSMTFMSQNLSLPFFELLATGETKTFDKEFPEKLKKVYKQVVKLLRQDARNIGAGYYPLDVYKTENWLGFAKRYPKILLDGFDIAQRRKLKQSRHFTQESNEYLSEVPDYFQRNFHFQSGGYLTDKSAELYEHQVEILFAGAADAMRRLIIPPMKKYFHNSQGEGLHFLEVGSGTGRLSRFVKMAFPKAKMTVLDLSYPYLKKAQDNLRPYKKINFIQGNAADLPFKNESFDAVFSCFLFHELPLSERRKALEEARRVLKARGFCGMVDSLQLDDAPDFEWALTQFPVDFHEPFFKNYTQNPMEGLLTSSGFADIRSEIGFFSKVVWGEKNP